MMVAALRAKHFSSARGMAIGVSLPLFCALLGGRTPVQGVVDSFPDDGRDEVLGSSNQAGSVRCGDLSVIQATHLGIGSMDRERPCASRVGHLASNVDQVGGEGKQGQQVEQQCEALRESTGSRVCFRSASLAVLE